MKKIICSLSILSLIIVLFNAFRFEDPKEGEMKQYFFVMLSKGPNRSQDSVTAAKLQDGHMANINKMAEDGKLCIAGPFADKGDWRGIFIIDTKTIEEAKALVDKDPAIQAGRLRYEIHPWWGGVGSKLK